jgi:hypothetical protein
MAALSSGASLAATDDLGQARSPRGMIDDETLDYNHCCSPTDCKDAPEMR